MQPQPRVLLALDDVTKTDDGWTAFCPICSATLRVQHGPHQWQLLCNGGCDQDELARWLRCDVAYNSETFAAFYRAVMLAPNLSVCEALLHGQTVPPGALDQKWVRAYGGRS